MTFVSKVRKAIIAWLFALDVVALATVALSTIPRSMIMLVLVIVNTHVFSKALNTPNYYFEGIETFSSFEKLEIILSMTTDASFNGFDMWSQIKSIKEMKHCLYKNATIIARDGIIRIKGFEHIWARDRETAMEMFARYLDIKVCDSTESE